MIKPGDIVGYTGRGWVSDAINIGTYGIPRISLSHVGIVAKSGGKLLVFESTSLGGEVPCEITGKVITGTQAHSLDKILELYNGRVHLYPLYRPLYKHEDVRLSMFLLDTIGIEYDKMGALRTAGVGLSWIESMFREENLATIFCSEWTAAAHSKIGVFPTVNVSRWNPNLFVRTERYMGILKKPERLK